jgi:hypothetical protein
MDQLFRQFGIGNTSSFQIGLCFSWQRKCEYYVAIEGPKATYEE